MQGSGNPIVGRVAQLHVDELVQPLWIWLDPAGFLQFCPGLPNCWVAYRDDAYAVRPTHVACFFNRLPY
jgi:hypothetical protein